MLIPGAARFQLLFMQRALRQVVQVPWMLVAPPQSAHLGVSCLMPNSQIPLDTATSRLKRPGCELGTCWARTL